MLALCVSKNVTFLVSQMRAHGCERILSCSICLNKNRKDLKIKMVPHLKNISPFENTFSVYTLTNAILIVPLKTTNNVSTGKLKERLKTRKNF